MQINDSYHLEGPVWLFVKLIHQFVIYSAVAALVIAMVYFIVTPIVLILLPNKAASTKRLSESKSVQSIHEEVEKEQLRNKDQMMNQEKENQKKIAEQQKLEEQRKQEAINRRRERSANAAAHDALDDFL